MELGMIGLGRMGGNMVQRLLERGHRVVAYDPSAAAVQALADKGGVGADSIANLIKHLTPPRAVWVMVPSGGLIEATIDTLSEALSRGDTVIDGGNSYYRDSMRRATALR
jgi:6-phosphogluconate dehydrogenase